jgi:diguanylate cyclase (GGDEF)-like protein
VLQQAAYALARTLRRGDVVARLGGDEFGILLSRISESEAQNALARLRAAVAAAGDPDEGRAPTASIGYAMAGGSGARAVDLFAIAERGLREAKHAGGDQVRSGAVSPVQDPQVD